MTTHPVFTLSLTPEPGDIDELGHVNNAVYVRWMQEIAVAHWLTVARAEDIARFVWVVTRHEIDYRRPTLPGETLTGRTWVGVPQGARFDRFVEFTGSDGRVKAAARTVWALIDRASQRPLRIPTGLVAPFLLQP